MDRIITVEGVKKTIFGSGSIKRLGEECKALGAKRAIIIADKALAGTTIVTDSLEALKSASIEVIPYFEVLP